MKVLRLGWNFLKALQWAQGKYLQSLRSFKLAREGFELDRDRKTAIVGNIWFDVVVSIYILYHGTVLYDDLIGPFFYMGKNGSSVMAKIYLAVPISL